MIETLIAYLYLVAGTIALAGYLPQLKNLLRAKSACHDISVKTWTIWSLEGLIALLYGLYCLKDMLFVIIAVTDLAFMLSIIVMVIHNRLVLFGPHEKFHSAATAYYKTVIRDCFISLSFIGKPKV